jgi:hypothetical protein
MIRCFAMCCVPPAAVRWRHSLQEHHEHPAADNPGRSSVCHRVVPHWVSAADAAAAATMVCKRLFIIIFIICPVLPHACSGACVLSCLLLLLRSLLLLCTMHYS